ncbi:MAG: cytoplasmic protein [Deltaproteobacteria bacterium]|nr:cytoplasmic protein [Deltaproteobacteria bacterium]
MALHSHQFVEEYQGFVGFGFNRETDEDTLVYYLQKFSDDRLMEALKEKMTDDELEEVFNLITRLLKRHLTEPQYHALFLKE